MNPCMKSGAAILVGSLIRQGVTTLFGYPGATVLPIYDELYSSPLRHILVRHEQAAAHAADGYARASGRTGVCIATSGPGACNLITGIATAYMDSSPLVAITGQVPTSLIGRDAFQEADITGMTKPVTKHNYLVKNTGELARTIEEAFLIAGSGRNGPVLIDIPKDVSVEFAPFEQPGSPAILQGYRPTLDGHPRQLARMAEMIARSERPVIYAGGGVIAAGASREVVRLAERMMIPVTTTLMGIGCIPGDHPLNLGMIGMHGTEQANHAVMECDLLIALGARFDDRVTGRLEAFAPQAEVIHVDIDPAEIGKNRHADLPVVGDVRKVLADLLERLYNNSSHDAWRRKIAGWQKNTTETTAEQDGLIHPWSIISGISDLSDRDTVIVTDVGQHQMWAARHFCFTAPRQFITSGGLGTMGFGLPAALGAACARPGSTVVCISGDGGIQMNIQELATVRQYNIPVKIFIMNNMFLGMVRQWQELFYERRYSYTELPLMDFARIARSFGIDGITVESCDGAVPAIHTALESEGPFLVDFRIAPEDNVFPMVPAGAALNEMMHGPHPEVRPCRDRVTP